MSENNSKGGNDPPAKQSPSKEDQTIEKTPKDKSNPYSVTHDLVEFMHETGAEITVEAELHKHFKDCQKNPGHQGFVPMNDFSLGHLPEECRSDDVLELVRAEGEMTFRVRVSHTSHGRPQAFPDTEMKGRYPYYEPGGDYPCKDWAGEPWSRVGTGYVWQFQRGGCWRDDEEEDSFEDMSDEEEEEDEDERDGSEENVESGEVSGICENEDGDASDDGKEIGNEADEHDAAFNSDDGSEIIEDDFEELGGPCLCRKNCPALNWARLEVWTALHVVFDQEEADHTEIELFFNTDKDRREGKTKKIKGGRVKETSIEGDSCHMYCYTHDESLVERLLQANLRWWDLWKKIRELPAPNPLPVVIVSHPHGCGKVVTVGQITEQKGNRCPVSSYNAVTCPGCSGAPVLWWNKIKQFVNPQLVSFPSLHSGFLTMDGKMLGRCGQWF